MCLKTESVIVNIKPLFKQVVQIAKKDIICFKQFIIEQNKLITPHKCFLWPSTTRVVTVPEFGVELYQDSDDDNDFKLLISEGLHAYTQEPPVFPGRISRRMVIPKGTEYIMSATEDEESNEIVALAMRLEKGEKRARPKRANPKGSKRKLVRKQKK